MLGSLPVFWAWQIYSLELSAWLGNHPTPAGNRQAADWLRQFSWLIPVVVGHFFLFCNVVRLRRAYELLWAGALLLNAGGTCYLLDAWHWWTILGIQTPATILLLVCEIKSPRYHGIFSRPTLGRSAEGDRPGWPGEEIGAGDSH